MACKSAAFFIFIRHTPMACHAKKGSAEPSVRFLMHQWSLHLLQIGGPAVPQ